MKFINMRNPLLESEAAPVYNPLIEKLTSTNKKKKVVKWYNKVTSETYEKVDTRNITLAKNNPNQKS